MPRIHPTLLALSLLVFGAACGSTTTGEAQEGASDEVRPSAAEEQQALPEGHYRTRGTIREIREERSSITIQHEDVPGYMPAMTMPFEVEDRALLGAAAVGDRVEFTFSREEGGRHVIRSLRRVSP